jgi:polyhydroxybutyrate depolymerase
LLQQADRPPDFSDSRFDSWPKDAGLISCQAGYPWLVHRFVIAIIVSAIWLASTSPYSGARQQDTKVTVDVRGQNRTAWLHVPSNFDHSQEYPLVVGYHGGAGNARGYIEQSQLFVKGERAGFIVVCPEGTPVPGVGDRQVWNSGAEYAASSRNADDVQFTVELIDRISSIYPVDSTRIYATGFSNGAQMTYRLAAELSDRIAAIAAMSGGRAAGARRPARPVPILHIHGMADTVYPLEGGLGSDSLGRVPQVAISNVIAEWSRFDGARLVPQITQHDGWEMRLHAGPAPVELILVKGMGHQISGGLDDHLPGQPLKSSPDAIDLALKFFAEHSL